MKRQAQWIYENVPLLTRDFLPASEPCGSILAPAGTLAARLAVPDRALDTFLLINELAGGEPLHCGESYKIVVE